MKHLSFIIIPVAALAFFSCKEKEEPVVEPAGPEVVVTLNEHEVSLNKGQTATLTCTAEGLAPGTQVFWRSQNSRIITVKDGVITPVSGGRTQVIAGWHQFRDTCEVSVIVPLEQVVLNFEEKELKLGKTLKLKAAAFPEDSTDPWELTWSSSNPSVAAVDANGVVTGLKEGDADIIATVGSVKGVCKVMVREKISAIVEMAANIRGCYFQLARNWVSNQNVLTFECLLRGDSFKNPNSAVNSLFGVEGSWLLRIGDVAPLADNQLEVAGGGWQTPIMFERGEWYHLAIVWDYSNRKAQAYLNGELVAEGTAGKQAQIAGTSSQRCRIGASYLDGSTNNRFFDGCVAEMRVWSVARTAEQIAEYMYEYDVEELGNAGLMAYWKFNEGEGNTVLDHSGNNRDITATGTVAWEDVALP